MITYEGHKVTTAEMVAQTAWWVVLTACLAYVWVYMSSQFVTLSTQRLDIMLFPWICVTFVMLSAAEWLYRDMKRVCRSWESRFNPDTRVDRLVASLREEFYDFRLEVRDLRSRVQDVELTYRQPAPAAGNVIWLEP